MISPKNVFTFVKSFLCLSAFLAVSSASSSGAAATADEDRISLLSAGSLASKKYGVFEQANVTLLVKNVSADKKVSIRLNGCTGWTETPAKYYGNGPDGYEVWDVSEYELNLLLCGQDLVFALKLEANGLTYWNNNNGQNFVIKVGSGQWTTTPVFGKQAALEAEGRQGVYFGGTVYVQNIAPSKLVTVVYTTDGWQTQQEVAATFNDDSAASESYEVAHGSPDIYGVEYWYFRTPVASGTTTVNYLVKYEVAGQTYFDNNFGHNYHLVVARP